MAHPIVIICACLQQMAIVKMYKSFAMMLNQRNAQIKIGFTAAQAQIMEPQARQIIVLWRIHLMNGDVPAMAYRRVQMKDQSAQMRQHRIRHLTQL